MPVEFEVLKDATTPVTNGVAAIFDHGLLIRYLNAFSE